MLRRRRRSPLVEEVALRPSRDPSGQETCGPRWSRRSLSTVTRPLCASKLAATVGRGGRSATVTRPTCARQLAARGWWRPKGHRRGGEAGRLRAAAGSGGHNRCEIGTVEVSVVPHVKMPANDPGASSRDCPRAWGSARFAKAYAAVSAWESVGGLGRGFAELVGLGLGELRQHRLLVVDPSGHVGRWLRCDGERGALVLVPVRGLRHRAADRVGWSACRRFGVACRCGRRPSRWASWSV